MRHERIAGARRLAGRKPSTAPYHWAISPFSSPSIFERDIRSRSVFFSILHIFGRILHDAHSKETHKIKSKMYKLLLYVLTYFSLAIVF